MRESSGLGFLKPRSGSSAAILEWAACKNAVEGKGEELKAGLQSKRRTSSLGSRDFGGGGTPERGN